MVYLRGLTACNIYSVFREYYLSLVVVNVVNVWVEPLSCLASSFGSSHMTSSPLFSITNDVHDVKSRVPSHQSDESDPCVISATEHIVCCTVLFGFVIWSPDENRIVLLSYICSVTLWWRVMLCCTGNYVISGPWRVAATRDRQRTVVVPIGWEGKTNNFRNQCAFFESA
jgi:hypothetical protein